MKRRITYGGLAGITIALGLLSRHYPTVPLWVGDVLWATMVFYMVGCLFINKPLIWLAVVSLVFCYAIECSQLYKAVWIDNLRQTLFGKLVLGSVFSWGDLLSYTAGVLIGVFTMISYHKKSRG